MTSTILGASSERTSGPPGGQPDRLYGGAGDDMLFGETGADAFYGGDRIELSRCDADITQGCKQAFSFVGDAGLTGTAGELGYIHQGGNTIVQADVDGDGAADFEIELTGIMDLTAGDILI